MTPKTKYFEYLRGRSSLGFFYRKFILYPKLNKLLEARTLDIGCGVGDFLEFRPDTIGVDINKRCVAWCKEKGMNVKHMKIDILPFEDESFDSIMLDNVLEHINNPDPLLKEVYRVLKKQGKLVVGVPGILGYKYDDDHKTFYSKNDLVSKIGNSGFINQKIFGMPLNLDFLTTKIRQYCIYAQFIKKI